jgi:hypothetical protein
MTLAHFTMRPASRVILSNAKNPSTPLRYIQDEWERRAQGDSAAVPISCGLM